MAGGGSGSITPSSATVVQSRLYEAAYVRATCVHCKAQVEYLAPSTAATEAFYIRCASCKEQWIVRPQAHGAGGKPKGKRRIGTDDKPYETAYYEALGVPVTASTDDIKRAYRRLAIKLHPDKNPNDPEAAEKFKSLAIAYNTLSDPGLRHHYNEFGPGKGDATDGEAPVDPEAIFSQLFGGERFRDIIGTISLGAEMKSALQQEEDDEDEQEGAKSGGTATNGDGAGSGSSSASGGKSVEARSSGSSGKAGGKRELSPAEKAAKEEEERKAAEERQKARETRVNALAERLRNKIALFTEQARDENDEQIASGVRTIWKIEADELKQESYGVELLQTVGFVYSAKSKHYLASTGPFPWGVAGWAHSVKSTVHILGETVSTVRSAYALKDVFEAIAAAEKSGLPAEKKQELEDKAAQMGLHALFKGAALEIQSVIREVCDQVLGDKGLSVQDLRKRAVAIGILGDVFQAVKKDPGQPSLMDAFAGGRAQQQQQPK